jgi:hypothetical protein
MQVKGYVNNCEAILQFYRMVVHFNDTGSLHGTSAYSIDRQLGFSCCQFVSKIQSQKLWQAILFQNWSLWCLNQLELENCTLLAYYAVCSGNSLPKFWDNLSVPSPRVKNVLGFLNLEYGTDKFVPERR